MDGYAICAKDEIEAETVFDLIGEIRAGQTTELFLQHPVIFDAIKVSHHGKRFTTLMLSFYHLLMLLYI